MKHERSQSGVSVDRTRVAISQRRKRYSYNPRPKIVMCEADGRFWWEFHWAGTVHATSKKYRNLASAHRSAYRIVDIINGNDMAELVPLQDHPYSHG